MSDFYASLTGGNVTKDDLQDEGVIAPSKTLRLVEDSPPPRDTTTDPRRVDIKQEANRVEEEIKQAAREAMKNPAADVNEVNNGLKGEVQQARKTALEWLSEGYNFWIVAAIVLFLIWRK